MILWNDIRLYLDHINIKSVEVGEKRGKTPWLRDFTSIIVQISAF